MKPAIYSRGWPSSSLFCLSIGVFLLGLSTNCLSQGGERLEILNSLKRATFVNQRGEQIAEITNVGLAGRITLGTPVSGRTGPVYETELDYYGLKINQGAFGLAFLGKDREGLVRLNMFNPQGHQTISISGDGYARIYNATGREAVHLGSNRDGSGSLNILSNNGRSVVTLAGDGVARFLSRNGQILAYLGAAMQQGNEVGVLRLNGRNISDYAEIFEMASKEGVIPGTVMSMMEDGSGVAPSNTAYDTKAIGIICGAGGLSPAMQIGTRKDGSGDLPISLCGQVYVRVCLEGGSLKVGDLLVSSSKRGVAMRGSDNQKALGAVIGKALEPFDGKDNKEEGLIRILVMSR